MRSFFQNLFGSTNAKPIGASMQAFLRESDDSLWSFMADRNKRFREEEVRKGTLCTEAEEILLEARSVLSKEISANRIGPIEFDTQWAALLARLRRMYTPRIVGFCLQRLGLPNLDEYGCVIHQCFLYP